MRTRRRQQSGFTVVELIITTCIVTILASIALTAMRDYTRRARISEVIMAATDCKNAVSEGYPVRDTAPDAGGWGCEVAAGKGTKFVGAVATSSDGVIRITIQNLDSAVDTRHVFLVPARGDGLTPLHASVDLGNPVRGWICGSDYQRVINSLPANCRSNTLTYASDEYQ